ncbi:MAG: phosphatidate cytidylyltransferase [Thiotrichaceae bacterium]|nr:phosphatidate cytidylyltransferase [Thiotrichaceae bacterium]
MLKQRIITATILLPVIVAAILLLSTEVFSIVTLVPILVLGGFEWARLAIAVKQTTIGNRQNPINITMKLLPWQFAYIVVLLVIASILFFYPIDTTVLLLALTCQVMIFSALAMYQKGGDFYKKNSYVFIVAGLIVLPSAWSLLTVLHKSSPYWVLFLIMLTVIADTAAYFTGKAFGTTKLALELSPNKTYAGMYGALVGGFIWSALGILFFNIDQTYWIYFILLILIVVIASISGDLFISMMKREAKMKDTGQLLPGHGGILDRVDSLLAAVVILTAGLIWSGIVIN